MPADSGDEPLPEADTDGGRALRSVASSGVSDTSPEVERLLVEGYRRMAPAQKLQRVVAMNRALDQLARARLVAQYGDMDERTLRLRLGALRLDPRVMADVFGWDPRVHGL